MCKWLSCLTRWLPVGILSRLLLFTTKIGQDTQKRQFKISASLWIQDSWIGFPCIKEGIGTVVLVKSPLAWYQLAVALWEDFLGFPPDTNEDWKTEVFWSVLQTMPYSNEQLWLSDWICVQGLGTVESFCILILDMSPGVYDLWHIMHSNLSMLSQSNCILCVCRCI